MDPDIGNDNADTNADDFEAGFSADASTQHSPTATPGGEGDDTRQQEAPPEYVQLTRKQLEELQASAALIAEMKATHAQQIDRAFGKLGGLERTLGDLSKASAVDISQDDIDAIGSDIPELGRFMSQLKGVRVIGNGGEFDPEKVGSLVDQRISPRLQRLEMGLLKAQHPDFATIDQDPAFGQWVATQPVEFQQGLAKASNEFDSEVVADAITKFKAQRKTPEQPAQGDTTRRSRFEAAVTPRGSGAAPRAPTDDDDFEAGFNS